MFVVDVALALKVEAVAAVVTGTAEDWELFVLVLSFPLDPFRLKIFVTGLRALPTGFPRVFDAIDVPAAATIPMKSTSMMPVPDFFDEEKEFDRVFGVREDSKFALL